MKILLITDNFLPHLGGSRIFFYNLCKCLPKKEISVLTRCAKKAENFDRNQPFKIYRVYLFKLSRKIFWTFYELPIYFNLFFSALFIIKKEKIKIVWAGETLPCGLVALLLKKILGLPYIIFTFAEDITILSKLNRERKIGWYVLRNADLVIATCSFVENLLKEKVKVDSKKIVKILPGIDEEIINFKLDEEKIIHYKKELGLDNKKVLFTCARLIERKGIDNVIKTLPLIKEKIPNVIYLIAGEGEYKNKLEDLVKKEGLEIYVKFLGNLDHYKELPYFYYLCDIFIMPSRQLENYDIEGFGLVFLEAGAFEKPVIGPNIGGPTDAIVDKVTGLQVNPYDINEIAKAIITLLSDKEYAEKLGKKARQRVIDEFRWQDRADKIYRITQKIVNGYDALSKK
jgi:phosphatidylinositol alpha-1,6-mannosyltransferase